MQYFHANDVEELAAEVVTTLRLSHVDMSRMHFIRSRGSKARRILARIHGMPKVWQKVLALQPRYVVEVIDKNYDRLPAKEKEKVIIHELLHVPRSFQGGLAPHKKNVTRSRVEKLQRLFQQGKNRR